MHLVYCNASGGWEGKKGAKTLSKSGLTAWSVSALPFVLKFNPGELHGNLNYSQHHLSILAAKENSHCMLSVAAKWEALLIRN